MPFKNKDLLVNLLPQGAINAAELAKICFLGTKICRFPTFCFHSCPNWGSIICQHCSHLPTITGCAPCSFVTPDPGCGIPRSVCPPPSFGCDATIHCFGSDPYVIKDLEDLVTLRGELHETLARLDQIEKEGLESGIQTRADADAMEKQLTEQLEYVRRRREGLK